MFLVTTFKICIIFNTTLPCRLMAELLWDQLMVIFSILSERVSAKLRGLNSGAGLHLCHENKNVLNKSDDNLVNHSYAALIHLCFYLPFLVSRNKYERTSRRTRTTSPSFPPLTCSWCCFRYSFDCFPTSDLTFRTSVPVNGLCFFDHEIK